MYAMAMPSTCLPEASQSQLAVKVSFVRSLKVKKSFNQTLTIKDSIETACRAPRKLRKG